jgi:hypothetical protein
MTDFKTISACCMLLASLAEHPLSVIPISIVLAPYRRIVLGVG